MEGFCISLTIMPCSPARLICSPDLDPDRMLIFFDIIYIREGDRDGKGINGSRIHDSKFKLVNLKGADQRWELVITSLQ